MPGGGSGRRRQPCQTTHRDALSAAKMLLPKLFVHNCFIKCEEWKMYPKQDVAVGYPCRVHCWSRREPHRAGPPRSEGHPLFQRGLQTRLNTGRSRSQAAVWTRGQLRLWQEGALISVYLEVCGRIYLLGSLGPFPWTPRWALEARGARGRKPEEGQEWADWGGGGGG